MPTINLEFSVKASADRVWAALTEPSLISKWSGGSVKFEANEGGKFSLWDGDIHGTNTKLVPNKLLAEDWFSDSTSETCYKVSFSLSEKDGITTVKLRHDNVADNEVNDFTDGWQQYYFDPIKQLLDK